MLIALIILILLTVMGISATNTTDIEFKIVQNTNLYKKNFYSTEGGGIEVAYDVNKAGGAVGCPDDRPSCTENYAILDITQPVIITETESGGSVDIDLGDDDDIALVDNYLDIDWPANYLLTGTEYGYRVFYTGQGPMPKGYGTSFGTYVFDVTSRKQSTPAEDEDPENLTTVINQGFRKIGPKAVL